ncbi:DUF4184 family protein [Chryseolinea sp. H1M3-3]|uniref:DUF4184 family protein n=1 Tax=Chryseolinea sp. H1M3-3 TaxID=3034144 RepID=UPI0023EADB51|nr:DUF4184 family protein [Chryseolinea sp. H1M3-3]
MPFTPAHSAIILPFIRSRYFSATGLIIGSLSPDFEYFFKMSVSGLHSHTKAGLFYFDLPVTIMLAIVFHQIVKANFIGNLPLFLQRRFQDTVQLNFLDYLKKNWLIFLTSALIGAASHIFWDSFTHNNRFFVRQFAEIYQSTSVPFQGANYPLFYVLQQVSTAVGMTIVTLYILFKKPVQDVALVAPKISYWLLVFAIGIAVLRIRFFIHSSDYNLGNVVVSGISGLLVGVVCCGFINFKNNILYQKA